MVYKSRHNLIYEYIMYKKFLGILVFLTFISSSIFSEEFNMAEDYAKKLDLKDDLKYLRNKYIIPTDKNNKEVLYFSGNCLGLQTKQTKILMDDMLKKWSEHGGISKSNKSDPWSDYAKQLKVPFAKLLGAKPDEIVIMNSLTTNLHLMLSSFYNPTKNKYKILLEYPQFPSDLYVVKSQMKLKGIDPEANIIMVRPEGNNRVVTEQDIINKIIENKNEISIILLNPANFLTGKILDIEKISKVAKQYNILLGLDLAHACGNIPLYLDNWKVDFAIWCGYKYLSGGPGAVGGIFVNEKYSNNPEIFRLSGWWGSDPSKSFKTNLEADFVPKLGAEGWQLSRAPVFGLIPLKSALDIFNEIGIEKLHEKSKKMSLYLEYLLKSIKNKNFTILTPFDEKNRGSQITLKINKNPDNFNKKLLENNIICTFREPNIIRIATVANYNTYHEIWQLYKVIDTMNN